MRKQPPQMNNRKRTVIIVIVALGTVLLTGGYLYHRSKEKQSKVKSEPRKVFGMENDGNKCYMISVLQNLFSLPEFVNFFTDKGTEERPLLKSIKDLYSEMGSGLGHPNVVLKELNKLLPEIYAKPFNESEQQDAADFYRGLLSSLILEAAKTSKKDSEKIEKMFFSMIKYKITCGECNFSLVSKQPAYMIFEVLDSGNMENPNPNQEKKDRCDRCKMKTTFKSEEFLDSKPNFLVITLNRGYYDKNTYAMKKLENEYNIKKTPAVSDEYEIVGFIEHKGSTLNFGHYYTYSKGDGKWYKLNDADVVEKSTDEIETVMKNNKFAYMIFYKRNG